MCDVGENCSVKQLVSSTLVKDRNTRVASVAIRFFFSNKLRKSKRLVTDYGDYGDDQNNVRWEYEAKPRVPVEVYVLNKTHINARIQVMPLSWQADYPLPCSDENHINAVDDDQKHCH